MIKITHVRLYFVNKNLKINNRYLRKNIHDFFLIFEQKVLHSFDSLKRMNKYINTFLVTNIPSIISLVYLKIKIMISTKTKFRFYYHSITYKLVYVIFSVSYNSNRKFSRISLLCVKCSRRYSVI